MKILHTADLHLTENKPFTLDALKTILKKAEELEVDYLTIGGDLFDSNEDANSLRPKLRNLFSNLPFDIYAIPGNHDNEAYANNLNFGSNFFVITDEPCSVIRLSDDINLCALPYTPKPSSKLLGQLKESVERNKTNILLLHCSLDIGYSGEDIGEEEEINYFPISSSVLSDLGYDYIIAGHFHSELIIKKLGDNTVFVYPGSPCSLTSKEIGKRAVALLDLEKKEINDHLLDTFFINKLKLMVYPNTTEEKLQLIDSFIKEHERENCELIIEIKGFGEMSETEFVSLIEEKIPDKISLTNEYRDISTILDNFIFQKFQDLLEESDYEDKASVENFVIEVFSDLIARGDIELE